MGMPADIIMIVDAQAGAIVVEATVVETAAARVVVKGDLIPLFDKDKRATHGKRLTMI